MATAGSVVIDLLMKTGSFETDSKRAEQRMRGLEKEAKRVGAAIGAAIAAGATAAAAAIKGSIDRMDDLSKAAQRAQMPTEEFSRLAYAGELADVAMQDLVTSMGKLARSQGDAARGLTTQVAAFETLGVAFKNTDGSLRSTTEVFRDFADVYQKFKGSPEVLAAGMQIFGRSFQNLIPLLKDGRDGLEAAADEADRLGYTISSETGRQAEEFNDNLTRLKTATLGLANAVAGELLPDLVRLSGEFVDSASQGEKLRETARDIADAISSTATVVLNFVDRLTVLRAEMAALELQGQRYTPFAGIRSLIDGGEYLAPYEKIVARQQELAGEAEAARARIAGRNAPAQTPVRFITADSGRIDERDLRPRAAADVPIITPTTGGGSKGGGGKSEAERAAEALERAYGSMNERLAEQIALHGTTGEAARVRYEIEHGALTALDEAKAAQLLKDAEHLDLLDEIAEHEQMVADIARETAEEADRRRQQFEDVLGAIRDEAEAVQMSADAQEVWNNLKWAGVSAESAWGQEIVAATEELQRQRDIMDDQITAMDGLRDAAKGFARDIRDGVGAWDSLKSAADAFVDVLWEIALNNLVEGLFGKQGDPGGGDWGDLVGQALGAFFGGGRASGGDVMPRTAYLVGEQGPEMFVPRTAGTIVPAGDTARAMGGGGNFTQNNQFMFAAPTDPRTQKQLAVKAGSEAQRAMARV